MDVLRLWGSGALGLWCALLRARERRSPAAGLGEPAGDAKSSPRRPRASLSVSCPVTSLSTSWLHHGHLTLGPRASLSTV